MKPTLTDSHSRCAVGNPHQLGAKPLTFPRQVCLAALCRADAMRQFRGCWLHISSVHGWLGAATECHAMRLQVAALCTAPFLLERPDVEKIFPKDAIAR